MDVAGEATPLEMHFMKRKMKLAGLMLASGVILQLGGCASVLAEFVFGQVFTVILRTIITGVTGTAADTTTA